MGDWFEETLSKVSQHKILYINPVIYTEVSIGFDTIEKLESAIILGGFKLIEIPKEAFF
jgi:hypothetical protein